jgi:putative hydrolase of the HAD superfamily
MSTPLSTIADKFLPLASEIELIIFDLGGVLLDIDYTLTQAAFANLGIHDITSLYSKAAQSDIFDRLETGAISAEEFRAAIRKLVGKELSDDSIDEAWNALIQRMPPHRLERVVELRKSHRTCILSNTNNIHIPCFERLMLDQGLMEVYMQAFEQLFYSSRIGLRKPDPDAFHYVLGAMKVSPEKALFIDDSIQHIVAARKLGIQSYHLEVGSEDISAIIARFLD